MDRASVLALQIKRITLGILFNDNNKPEYSNALQGGKYLPAYKALLRTPR